MNQIEIYKIELAKVLQTKPNNLFLYWKGRVALYAALKTIGVTKGDEVIMPAFTCVVVPNAVKYLGATPIYVDVNQETYNSDLNKIKDKISGKTKAVLVQNTFGLSSEVDSITAYCKSQKITTIEDCTHGFGGYFEGKPNGSYCDFAFYSSQWNKPFSTGIGGFLLVNNEQYLAGIERVNMDLKKPTLKERVMLRLLLFAYSFVLTEWNYWKIVGLYRWLSKKGIVVGSSDNGEITGITIPNDYFKTASSIQCSAGLGSLNKFDSIQKLRKKNAVDYSEFLSANNKIRVDSKLFKNHSFLKYPLLVKNRDRFMEIAEANQIKLGEWFTSPLHPIQGSLVLWDLNIKNYPNAEYLARHVVNLPTDIKDSSRVLLFLKENLSELINTND